MQDGTSARNTTLDRAKGLAIFLVVWGHTIQYLTPGASDEFYSDPAFKIIYSFHMPLFMAVSGFLFAASERKYPTRVLLKKRLERLLIPTVVWSLLIYAGTNLVQLALGREMTYRLQDPLWFLMASLFCSSIAILCRWAGKGNWLAYAVAVPLSLALPDRFQLRFDKFMLPYFFAGILLYRCGPKISRFTYQVSCVASLLIWWVLLRHWKPEDYIYVTGMSLTFAHPTHKLLILGYRFLAGMAGVISFTAIIFALRSIVRVRPLVLLGQFTMGVYVLTTPAMVLLRAVRIPHARLLVYDLVSTPLIASVLCVVAVWITRGIERNRWTNLMLLGVRT